MGKSYYEILGVQKSATDSDIKRAYRKLVLKWHPDRNKSPEAADIFGEIQKAYDTLADDGLKANYDAALDGDDSGWQDAIARQTPLMRACDAADVSEVQRILKETPNINAVDALMQSALLYAAGSNQGKFEPTQDRVQCVRDVLSAAADVNAMNDRGHTTMSLVCESGNVALVYLLLSKNASPNPIHDDARSPLVCAAEHGDEKIVKALLTSRATVQKGETGGFSALMIASERGDLNIVTQLVEAKADVNTETVLGESALLLAVTNTCKHKIPDDVGIKVIQRLLIAGADPLAFGTTAQFTPLQIALNHQSATISSVLQEGASTQAQGNTSQAGCFDGCCSVQ